VLKLKLQFYNMNYVRYLFLCLGILLFSFNFLSTSKKKKNEYQKQETKKKADSLDYAPGYPGYSVLAINQLKYFPRPRFKPGVSLHRNFSWFNFFYMAYDYTKVITEKSGNYSYPGLGKNIANQPAIDMNYEMTKNWNYYFNIPTPTYYANDFSNTQTFAGHIISYANLHPEIPTCTQLFWVGISPNSFGYPRGIPYIRTDEAIDPCKNNHEYPSIEIDGIVQRKYLQKAISALPNRDKKKKIDFINENGEVFGTAPNPNAEGYRNNPLIACIQKNSSTARQDRGHWQYEVFNSYKKQFIKSDSIPGLYNAEFSFYQISAFLPFYYGEYAELRKINQFYKNNSYSTPDFYPGDNRHGIFDRYAAFHGLNCIAEGRKREIEQGDSYFSPFVCAGWWRDSLNYRPAPWLASLKVLSAMGAEYFYPAFFDLKNPAVEMPINPSGYIYQVVMPVYAQAITSRYSKIFYNSKDFIYERDGDMLSVYREDAKTPGVFVISANWFKDGTGNETGDVVKQYYLSVGKDKIKINYRRQGSVYIYDCRNPSKIIFYQLDEWHESIHPYYWSRDFVFEAELHDDSTEFKITTEIPENAEKNDFTTFTTSVSFSSENLTTPLIFHFHPTEKDTSGYYVWVRARYKKRGEENSVKISLNGKELGRTQNITSENFQWYCIQSKKKALQLFPKAEQENELTVFALNEMLEIDKVILSVSSKIPKEKRK